MKRAKRWIPVVSSIGGLVNIRRGETGGQRCAREPYNRTGSTLSRTTISTENLSSLAGAAQRMPSAVHVPMRPEWISVNVHAHRCRDPETLDLLLGDRMQARISEREGAYNGRAAYRLHRITA